MAIKEKEKKDFLPSFLNKKKKEENEVEGYNSSKPFESRLPGVNLIPQSVLDGYALRAYQGKLIKFIVFLIIVILLIGAGLFGLQKVTEFRLNQAQTEEANYAKQVKALQPYENYKEEVSAKGATISSKMSAEIDTGKVSDTIRKIAKDAGVKLDTTTVTVNTGETIDTTQGAPTSNCVAASPFNSSPAVGCVAFSGTGDRDGVSKFLEGLDQNESFNNAFVPKTSSGESAPTFEGTVNFSGDFSTNNYSDLLGGEENNQNTNSESGATP